MRGGSSEETQTFIDGLQVLSPYGASAPNTATRGRFNPFMFSGTVFSTGGYSAEYGQALSSALILNTNDMPVQDQFDLRNHVGRTRSGRNQEVGNRSSNSTCGIFRPEPLIWPLCPRILTGLIPSEAMQGSVNVRQKHGDHGMLKFYATGSSANFALNQAPSRS